MNVVIIEDEKPAAEKLFRLIHEVRPDVTVTKQLESVEESINWFMSNSPPGLVFMDIQLDDGICFEIFESVKLEVPIIFTTAYDEYAIKAFKVNSVDYLLKPIEKDALAGAFVKFQKTFGQTGSLTQIEQVIGQLSKKYKERFFIKVGSHYRSVAVNDILCFYVEGRATFVKTVGGKNYSLDYSLGQLQEKINPELFFRINRNYLVNMNTITDIVSYSTSRMKIKLINFENDDLIISRDKVSDFKKWMDR